MNKSLFSLLIFTSATVLADDDAETIAIIGSRSDIAVQIPATVQVISAQDIEQSGASSIAEVLATQIGLQLSDVIGNGGRGVSISMRGFGENASNNVLVLVDGRKLNNPSLSGADLSTIALSTVARIEILQGSAGSLYGDQASGGVINIITKSASKDETNTSVSVGSYASKTWQGSVAKKLNNSWSIRANATQSDSDNYRDNNESKNQTIDAKLQWRIEAGGVALSLQRSRDDLQFPGALSETAYRDNRRQSSTPVDFGDNITKVARLNGDWSLNEQWAFFWDLTQRERDENGEIFGSSFDITTDVETVQPRFIAQLDGANGAATVVLGIDHEESGYESEYVNSFGATVSDIAQRNNDLYVQAIWPIMSSLTFTGAARHSRYEFSPLRSSQDYQDQMTVYQLGLSKQIASWRWFVRFDQGFRWPNADENGFIANNIEHLKPQRSKTSESGVEWRNTQHQFSVNVFNIDMDNEIFFDPVADGPWGAGTGANVNRDFVTRRGYALAERWHITESLNWSIAYSYIDASFDGGAFDGNDVPYVAKHSIKSQVLNTFSENWSAYVEADYTGSRYHAGDTTNQTDELGGYTVFNANLRWQRQQWFVQLRVNNVFDKIYSSYAGVGFGGNYYYSAAERNAQLTVGYQFE